MKCPICGAYNLDDDKNCFICGARLDIDPFASDLDEIERLSEENTTISQSILSQEPKKKKKSFWKGISGFFIGFMLLLLACSLFSCVLSLFMKGNKDKIEEYIESNKDISAWLGIEDNHSDNSDDSSDETNLTREEYIENFSYDMFELKNVGDSSVDLKLPKQMEAVEFEEDEKEDPYIQAWRYGLDFDIIQIGTMQEFSNMKEAAETTYQNGVEEGYCSNMQIEEDTISGYPAYKVSGLDSYNQQYLVIWIFEAPDKDDMVHYFAANVLVEDKVLLDAKDTYIYHGISE